MSLINEALKKAQKQRTGEAPPLASMPAIGGEAPARIAGRQRSVPLTALLVRLGGGVSVLAVLVVAGLFLFRDKPATTATSEATPPPALVASAPAPAPVAAPAADGPAAVPPAAGNTFVLPIAPPPEPVAAQPEPVAVSVATVPVPEPEKPAPTPAPVAGPPGRLEPRATTFIENIRVAGIRASGTDSKVLMNDRVYRIGDLVEHELGLRLVGITSSSLTFEDERGGRYTRNF